MHIAVMVSLSSVLARVGIDIHSRQYDKPGDETYQAVGRYEADNGSAHRRCRPIDVSSLNPQELKRPLQPLEQRIVRIAFFLAFHPLCGLGGNTEEQRQRLGCSYQEDAGSHYHHHLFLHVLFFVVHRDIDADGSNDGDDTSYRVA